MRSDIIHVSSTGKGFKEALAQAEAVAAYKSLDRKEGIQLRLLTEEMMGVMQAITGDRKADFWIEDTDGDFELHLKTVTNVNSEMREQLLATSSTGKNMAAKGFMGKIRELFEKALEPVSAAGVSYYTEGWMYGDPDGFMPDMWSFSRYIDTVDEAQVPKEEWDELERSIVKNIADDVQISISDNTVEMIIKKKF
jgi:hypothetical protein